MPHHREPTGSPLCLAAFAVYCVPAARAAVPWLDPDAAHTAATVLLGTVALLIPILALLVWRLRRTVADLRNVSGALKASDDRYRAFIANSSEGILRMEFSPPIPMDLSDDEIHRLCYERGVIAECNEVEARLRGFPSAGAMVGQPLAAIRNPDDPVITNENLAMIRAKFNMRDLLNRERRPDGSVRYYNTSCFSVIENGALLRVWGVQRDITERKRTEEMLSALAGNVTVDGGEAFFRSLVEHLGTALQADNAFIARALPNQSGRMMTAAVWVRGKFAPNTEFDLEGTPCEKVSGSEICIYREKVRELFPNAPLLRQAKAEGYAGALLRGADGEPIGLMGVLYRNPMGDPRLVSDTLRILSARASAELERERVEADLRASEERYRAFIGKSSEGIFRCEFDPPVPLHLPEAEIVRLCYSSGRIAEANDACARMRGLEKAADMVGKKPIDFRDGSDPINAIADLKMARAKSQAAEFLSHHRLANGSERYFHTNIFPVVENGLLLRMWGVQRDVTERKHTEETITNLAKGVSANTGNAFFRSLVEHLALALRADGAFVCEFYSEPARRARVVAGICGLFAEVPEEFDLTGTPCDSVRDGNEEFIETGAWRKYPDDPLFAGPKIEFYAATPILDSADRVRGHIVVISRTPLPYPELVRSSLRIFASRAAAEMDRLEAEEELRESERRLRALAAKLESATESERTRIAREIHDELGQQLTAIKMGLAMIRNRSARGNGTTPHDFADLLSLVDSTISSVRRIATELRPPVLDNLGLNAAIEWQCRETEKQLGIPVHCRLQEAAASPELATTIFRILQEALTNVARHAGANEVSVVLRSRADSVELEVSDDGRGIAPADFVKQDSLGLLGMRERAASAGGAFDVTTGPGLGTRICVRFPLAGSTESATIVTTSAAAK